ncbi:MAG: PAS domain-containing protein [Proteobacteria bacterium]|nr:PAS domain-containing protein [Pseudomonadota bacterium]
MIEPENIEVLPADMHAGLRYGRHKALFAYWEKIKGTHAMPSRADFDPVDIPKLLTFIGLVDIVQPGPKFRYRVVGTAISARFSQPLDRRFVEDATTPEYGVYLERVYSLPFRLKTPVYITERTGFSMGYEKIFARLMLPMGRDRKTPDMILCSAISETPDNPELDSALMDPRSVSAMEVMSLKVA